MKTETTTANPAMQTVNGHSVIIKRVSSNGMKFALIDGKKRIPAALLSLAAGRDAWMRDILVKCSDCGERCKAGEMETEAMTCQACYDKASELEFA